MAIFHFSAKIVSRGKGQSAVAKAAYNARAELTNEKTGERHDYTRAEGLTFEGIFAPKNAPDWAQDRERLWSEVEKAETRKNSQLAREVQIALPHELTQEQRRQLLTDFVRENFVRQGMVADVAIHAPDREGDDRNHHAHILLTMREIGPDGFGAKLRELNGKEHLETWRENWARTANRYLERHGHEARIDHRSLEAQGIDREPTTHNGPTATQMEREGEASERGDLNREIEARNKEREGLKEEARDLGEAQQERPEEGQRPAPREERTAQRSLREREAGRLSALLKWSDNAEDFRKLAEREGFRLAQNDRAGVLALDAWGNIYSFPNHAEKLAGLDRDSLPDVAQAKALQEERRELKKAWKENAPLESEWGMVSQQREAMHRFKENNRRLNETPRPWPPEEAAKRREAEEAQKKAAREEAERQAQEAAQKREAAQREARERESKEREQRERETREREQREKEAREREERTRREQSARQDHGAGRERTSYQQAKAERDALRERFEARPVTRDRGRGQGRDDEDGGRERERER